MYSSMKAMSKVKQLANLIAEPRSVLKTYLAFFLTSWIFELLLGHSSHPIRASLEYSVLSTCLVLIVTRIDIFYSSLFYLCIPYMIFALGWLREPIGVLFFAIFSFCLGKVILTYRKQTAFTPINKLSWQEIAGFCLVFVWIKLSGAGGYGYQTEDYLIHNGRLKDLIEYAWPVKYAENQNLVVYSAYYLPSAILGKLTHFSVAYRSMFWWTLLGVMLIFRWMSRILNTRYLLGIVSIFIVFGGWNIIGNFIFHHQFFGDTEALEWWAARAIGYFVGGYISGTFSLFWSPGQVIAGWMIMCLMTDCFYQNRLKPIGFIYALAAFWSPMILLGMALFPAAALFSNGKKSFREMLSLESVVGGLSIVLLFGIYYLGGSAFNNPTGILWQVIDLSKKWPILMAYYLFSWGVFAVLVWPTLKKLNRTNKIWFGAAIVSLLLLPFYKYGRCNDFVCRGAAPSMFLICLFVLGGIYQAEQQISVWYRRLLVMAIVPGIFSAAGQIYVGITRYGDNQRPIRAPDFGLGYQYLGPDQSFFMKYLAKRKAT